jgi:hypothetical protein
MPSKIRASSPRCRVQWLGSDPIAAPKDPRNRPGGLCVSAGPQSSDSRLAWKQRWRIARSQTSLVRSEAEPGRKTMFASVRL